MPALLLVSLIWAVSPGLIKGQLIGFDSGFISAARLGLALLVFLPLLRPGRLPWRASLALIGIGAVQFGLMYLAYNESFRHLQSYEVALFTLTTPIFVTPMVRRTFTPEGQLDDPLQAYADAMKAVGQEKNVPVIDLHETSKALVQRLGPTKSADLANKAGDLTHFNEKGARTMADLVMKELPRVAPKLAALLKD